MRVALDKREQKVDHPVRRAMPRKTSPALPALLLAALALARCIVYQDFYTDHHTTNSAGTGSAGGCTPGETADCYDGPAGTAGVGICKAGKKTCGADGMTWGPCVGEVTPKPQNCASGLDEHCDGKVPLCKGSLLWAKRFGDASDQYGAGICSDPGGNVVVTGAFNGTIDFGASTLASAGGRDVFLAKLDASGSHVWSKSFGDVADQIGYGVASDGAGNVLLAGGFAGTVNFGGKPLTSASPADVFAVKFDGAGNHVWSKGFGGPSGQVSYSVASDTAGGMLLVGVFYGTVDFGGGTLTSQGAGDIFVAKLDASGNHVWSRRFGDASNQTGYGVATDAMDNVVITGTFGGTVDFGGGALASAGGGDVFVVKLDASGNHVWSRRFGDVEDQIAYSVATDTAGNILLTGLLYGTADFGGGTLKSSGGGDIFALKLDASGNHVWSKRFGDESYQNGYSVATDPAGNVVVTGTFAGLVDFGGGPLTSAGKGDVFIAKFGGDKGDHLWSRRAGAAGEDGGSAAATDSAGNVLVIGDFAQAVDFGAGPLQTAGGSDVFVAKFAP
jgi:hypothetical protein